jgi:hypothetical protein
MFGVRDLTNNYKFVKDYSKEVINSELHAKSTGRKPIEADPKQLSSTYNIFKKLFISYLIIFFAALIYSSYNFGHHHIVAGFLSIGFSLLCLSFAFRYHFWMFQIKRGELGCTFKDWYNATIMGKGV